MITGKPYVWYFLLLHCVNLLWNIYFRCVVYFVHQFLLVLSTLELADFCLYVKCLNRKSGFASNQSKHDLAWQKFATLASEMIRQPVQTLHSNKYFQLLFISHNVTCGSWYILKALPVTTSVRPYRSELYVHTYVPLSDRWTPFSRTVKFKPLPMYCTRVELGYEVFVVLSYVSSRSRDGL